MNRFALVRKCRKSISDEVRHSYEERSPNIFVQALALIKLSAVSFVEYFDKIHVTRVLIPSVTM